MSNVNEETNSDRNGTGISKIKKGNKELFEINFKFKLNFINKLNFQALRFVFVCK